MDCIAHNPTVFLSAVTKCAPTVGPKDGSFTLQYKSATAIGKAEIVTDREEKIAGLRAICQRFLPHHMDAFDDAISRSLERTAVVKITLMHQWGEGYPTEAVITADMERNGGFIIEDDGCIVGYFAFLPSPEPTYAKIYEGKWINDTQPYHVVHRIASYPDAHGIFSSIMEFCFSNDENIRIDTHHDNKIMQHNILKHGFTYCGIIYLLSGDERLAYQKIVI